MILSISGLLLAVLTVEILLRAVDYEGLSRHVKDPVLGQKYKPHFTGSIRSSESGRRIPVRINSLGFRDTEHREGPSPHGRVVVLGDSFVAGFAVPFEATLSQAAERRLRKQSTEPWEVINFGVSGFGTAQEMRVYEEYGRRFFPDYVVLLFFAGNDVSDNSPELSTNPRIYYRLDDDGVLTREPFNLVRSRLSGLLNEYSRFYIWQKRQVRKLERLVKSKVVVNPVFRVFEAEYGNTVTRAWAVTRALILKLRSLVESDGATFLLVYAPFADEVYPDWWRDTLANSPPMQSTQWEVEKPERLLSEFARDNGLNYVSLRSAFSRAAPQSGERLYFKHGHFNENGHRRAGELIAEWVLAHTRRVGARPDSS